MHRFLFEEPQYLCFWNTFLNSLHHLQYVGQPLGQRWRWPPKKSKVACGSYLGTHRARTRMLCFRFIGKPLAGKKILAHLLFSKAHAHVRLNALSAGLSPGSKKRLEAQAKIGTHSRFVRPCQASALLTWYTSDLWYTSLICAKAKMMDLTGNGKHHNCKKGPETPKKTLTKNINSMYRPIGEQTLESTEGGTTWNQGKKTTH